ncbi:hypothetical protein B0H14DRAFT_2418493 [Mycena olivaceomarginata]|nr:hypothetical protein B0H14DRAFT_2418493 [Mycena olivaceomarginata]
MWNGTRFYIGEILDVYKKGANSRYGSVRNSTTTSGLAYISMRVYLCLTISDDEDERDPAEIDTPMFSCRDKTVQLYTHAKMDHLLFNLGSDAFEKGQNGPYRMLTAHAAVKWTTLTKTGPVAKEVKKLTLKLGKGKKT